MDIQTGLLIGFAILAAGLAMLLIMRRNPQNEALPNILSQLERSQTEIATRMAALTQAQATERGELQRTLNERLEQVTQSVHTNLRQTNETTGKSLSALNERLGIIDAAQKEISALSGQVVGLQQILDNKQARGSFGETRLNDLVQDALPRDAYSFQHQLSNGKRADCLILLPNPPGSIVVDSKFPLESYQAMRNAETSTDLKKATDQLARDTLKHARDIADRYIIPGETADAALMFLPSESVFSELHLSLPDAIQKCREMRVYPVSPNTMWLTLNTVRAIMRDVEMHQKASLIQKEVRVLMEDVGRLGDRVDSLRRHFGQAEKDILDIETSSRKISSRGEKISNAELENKSETASLDFTPK